MNLFKHTSLVALFILISNSLTAQQNFWEVVEKTQVKVIGEKKIIPQQFILTKLNTTDFKIFQSFVPKQEQGNFPVLSLPTPDGNMRSFYVFECPMMESPLYEKYSEIKTYTAIATDNSLVTAKLDYTVLGFHAKVFAENESYFIDPFTNENTGYYMVYNKSDFHKPLNERMACHIDEDFSINDIHEEKAINLDETTLPQISFKTNGLNKRTYRLALACTVEYSAAVGGPSPTKASVLSAMVTTMNRVNGVLEKDFSYHANLIGNNDTLIFIGTTDPYTNSNGSTMLGQNQTTVNARIGSANYDFGHVFSTGGGGIASLASVCGNNKAQGVTGSSNPVGDPFDIDYVAHEMGHQFGGSHTFNSVTGSCSGNRSSTSAYEIGSATTIMGYAGICGNDNIQNNSDDYYHIRSLEQMTGNSVTSCGTVVPSNNTLPLLNTIHKIHIIPYRTSFELTATGSDADNNPITYCWEQWDRGGNGSAWDAKSISTPYLRSFKPTVSATRVFPTFLRLLQNTESYKGERLSDTNRLMRFKCTLRDINNGYGGFFTSPDSLVLDIRKTNTLFRVTSQNTNGQTFNAFTPQTVTWDVAGTNAAPFNTANVTIFISTDSGKNWTPLALNTANDGSEVVYIPNQTATWCRFKVKASDNVYFDLNDNWFAIKEAPASVNSILQSSDFSIYPNPVLSDLHIESTTNEMIQQIEIKDISGRVVYSIKPYLKQVVINTINFANGIYAVELITEKGKFVSKIVK